MAIYAATRPLRFDRLYQVGEHIPSEVIDPKALKRLLDMERLTVVPEDMSGFACSVCGKVCANQAALIAHRKSHGSA